jgi:hypothetical protein
MGDQKSKLPVTSHFNNTNQAQAAGSKILRMFDETLTAMGEAPIPASILRELFQDPNATFLGLKTSQFTGIEVFQTLRNFASGEDQNIDTSGRKVPVYGRDAHEESDGRLSKAELVHFLSDKGNKTGKDIPVGQNALEALKILNKHGIQDFGGEISIGLARAATMWPELLKPMVLEKEDPTPRR